MGQRARALGLDLDRFDSRPAVRCGAGACARDFQSGVRAGVVTTPTLFVPGGGKLAGNVRVEELEELERG